MDGQGRQLMVESLAKNMSDVNQYPAMTVLYSRCILDIADLWNVPKGEQVIGITTMGLSEVIRLRDLATKRRWQEKRPSEGKDTLKQNIVIGANDQVGLERFAR